MCHMLRSYFHSNVARLISSSKQVWKRTKRKSSSSMPLKTYTVHGVCVFVSRQWPSDNNKYWNEIVFFLECMHLPILLYRQLTMHNAYGMCIVHPEHTKRKKNAPINVCRLFDVIVMHFAAKKTKRTFFFTIKQRETEIRKWMQASVCGATVGISNCLCIQVTLL